MSKDDRDKYSAERRAEAIAKAAASGSQTNQNLSMVQQNLTRK
jgi:hypothetical protein